MTQTPNDLRLQACLLVLFLFGLFAGLVGLVVAMFPVVPVPESLRMSLEGALPLATRWVMVC